MIIIVKLVGQGFLITHLLRIVGMRVRGSWSHTILRLRIVGKA